MKIDIKTVILFIGYGRSGHSVIANILNSHPNILISDEIGIIKENLKSKTAIINRIINHGKKHPPRYNSINKVEYKEFNIPKTTINVIGDKHANQNTKYISRNFNLFENFRVNSPNLKLIHVIRNPYDIITTKFIRRKNIRWKGSLNKTINEFNVLASTVKKLKQNNSVLDIKLEELIYHPEENISMLFDYVGVKYNEELVKNLSGILLKKPSVTRNKLNWSKNQITTVQNIINIYDWLKGYEYGN